MEELLTVKQAAQHLHLTEDQIYNWVRRGRLRVVKLGHRTMRIPRRELEAFLAAHTIRKGQSHAEQ